MPAEDYVAYTAQIAQMVIGTPNRGLSTRDQWRYGSNGSLSVEIAGPNRGTWFDHEHNRGGGLLDFLYIYAELETGEALDWLEKHFGQSSSPSPRQTFRQTFSDPAPKPKVVARYDYVDEQGETLFIVERLEPKSFRQRTRDRIGKGAMDGVRRVPYHLDEITNPVGRLYDIDGEEVPWRVYLTEGEKACDRLRSEWKVLASCGSGGAGKWDRRYAEHFANADVVILADNDQAGRDHAEQVARSLADKAQQIRIVGFPSLPEKADIWDAMEKGLTQSDFEALVDQAKPYGDKHRLVDPDQPDVKSFSAFAGTVIPPRPWLLGTNFCRGYLSGLTGAGAGGKTALRYAQLLALATGRGDITGEKVFQRTPVLIVGLEDDEVEMVRRLTAACAHHKIDPKILGDWVLFWCPKGLKFTDADRFGNATPGKLGDALKRIIKAKKVGLVCVDPFVKSHGASENDNNAVDLTAQLFLEVAFECGCAVDYVHHTRKGLPIAGNADNSRGASALANASRLLKSVITMTAPEALGFNIEASDRWKYIRLDDAKINIAPAADNAMWFKLVGVPLHNGNGIYPDGDVVQTVERWTPPDPFEGLNKLKLAAIFAKLRAGPEEGELFRKRRAEAELEKWAGTPIIDLGGVSDFQARQIVDTWIARGVLLQETYQSKGRHGAIHGLRLNEMKAAEMLQGLWHNTNNPGPPKEE